MKLFIFAIIVLINSSFVSACGCVTHGETLKEIYDDSEGIYYVAVTAINMLDEQKNLNDKSFVELDLDLKVFHVFKGTDKKVIKGHAYGRIPFIDRNGKTGEGASSCDLKISFGDTFIISEFGDGEIMLTMCSDNILEKSNWKKLETLKTNKL